MSATKNADSGAEFSWNDDDESVVIEAVNATAVYANPKGDIVIRQQDPYGHEDSFIVVPRSRAGALADAINNELERPVPEKAA
jgi:hypothetical protein